LRGSIEAAADCYGEAEDRGGLGLEEWAEEYVQQSVKEVEARNRISSIQMDGYFKKMDGWLQNWQEDGKQQMEQLLDDEDFIQAYSFTNKIPCLREVMPIWKQEENELGGSSLLEGIDRVEALLQRVQKFRLLLWRLEFYPEEDTGEAFLEFVQKNRLSDVAMEGMVHAFSMKKRKTLLFLARIFRSRNRMDHAWILIQRGLQAYLGDIEFLQEAADYSSQCGMESVAQEFRTAIAMNTGRKNEADEKNG
jgi:hypothetical protein